MAVSTQLVTTCDASAFSVYDENGGLLSFSVDPTKCVSVPVLSSEQISQLDLLLSASSNIPEILGITPLSVAESFLWGFGVVIFSWYLAYPIGIAIKVIRRV